MGNTDLSEVDRSLVPELLYSVFRLCAEIVVVRTHALAAAAWSRVVNDVGGEGRRRRAQLCMHGGFCGQIFLNSIDSCYIYNLLHNLDTIRYILQLLHRLLYSPSNQPANLRYPRVPDASKYVDSFTVFPFRQLIQYALPTTHCFTSKHSTLTVNDIIHSVYPGVPFLAQMREKKWQ